jgi:hypothetical protein
LSFSHPTIIAVGILKIFLGVDVQSIRRIWTAQSANLHRRLIWRITRAHSGHAQDIAPFFQNGRCHPT